MSPKTLVISLVLIITSQTLFSQEQTEAVPPEELEEVILTATRTKRQLSSLPLPASLISQKTIKQSGSLRLQEILNEQTGIITIADESGFEGVQIQGISSDYILILIDGVPLVGRSAGNFDLSRLTVGNIKQIEVVKGPSSSLYGSEALGGVINIITEKPPSEQLDGNVTYRIGSNTTQDVQASIKQGFEKLRYALFTNRNSSNGYDLTPQNEGQTVNPFVNYTVNGRVYYDFSDKLSLFGSARLYDQEQEAGLTVDNVRYEGDTDEREYNTHLKLDQKFDSPLTTTYELYYTNYQARELLQDPISAGVLSDNDFNQKLWRPEVRGNYAFAKAGSLTTGIGLQYDQLDRTFFDETVRFNSQYIYAQYDTTPLDKLNVIAGLRYDNHSEYSDQLSPKIALRYEATDAIAIKGSVGYGFKAPDFRQLYFDFTNAAVGYTVLGYNVALSKLQELQDQDQILDVLISQDDLSQPLAAESSVGYNLGVTYKKGKWNAELNGFRNDFKNLIDTRIIARKLNGQNVFSYANFDKVFTTGFELNATYTFSKELRLSAGYQLLYAYNNANREAVRDGQVFARDPATNQTVVIEEQDHFGLINRSRHNANAKLFYNIPSLDIAMNVRLLYRSKYAQFDTNGNNLIDRYDTSFVDGYLTTNVAASKTFYNDFTLQVGANNLFDYKDSNIPTLPGIQGYASLNYQF